MYQEMPITIIVYSAVFINTPFHFRDPFVLLVKVYSDVMVSRQDSSRKFHNCY